MFDYPSIKALAKASDRPVKDLLALSKVNDPFYAASVTAKAAHWFGGIWSAHAGGAHLYDGSTTGWSRHGRVFDTVAERGIPEHRERLDLSVHGRACGSISRSHPFDGLIDRRNDEPMIFAGSADQDFDPEVSCCFVG